MEGESVKAVLGGGWSASWLCTGTHTCMQMYTHAQVHIMYVL